MKANKKDLYFFCEEDREQASSTIKQRKKQTCLSCRHHKHQSTKSGLIVICDGMKKKFNPIPAPWPRCVWFVGEQR